MLILLHHTDGLHLVQNPSVSLHVMKQHTRDMQTKHTLKRVDIIKKWFYKIPFTTSTVAWQKCQQESFFQMTYQVNNRLSRKQLKSIQYLNIRSFPVPQTDIFSLFKPCFDLWRQASPSLNFFQLSKAMPQLPGSATWILFCQLDYLCNTLSGMCRKCIVLLST